MDWHDSFESRGAYRAACRLCGQELDTRGGRPQKHLSAKHGAVITTPDAPQQPTPQKPGDDKALSAIWNSIESLGLTPFEQERARQLIIQAKIDQYAQAHEETPEEVRDRHLRRVETAIERQDGAEREISSLLSHPVNGKAAREWLRDLLVKADSLDR